MDVGDESGGAARKTKPQDETDRSGRVDSHRRCSIDGQASPKRTIEANSFNLTDSNGKKRASLDIMAGTGAGLFFYDKNGKVQAEFSTAGDLPELTLRGEKGHVASLAVCDIGPRFIFWGQNGKQQIQLDGRGDFSHIELNDREGFQIDIGKTEFPKAPQKTTVASIRWRQSYS